MPNENDVTNPAHDDQGFEVSAAPADETLNDEIVDALFDGGDGNVTFADIDGDGRSDAVVSDTDNDGHIDAIAVDSDGDGKLDEIAMDTDGDGHLDAIALDTDGDGEFDTALVDEHGDGNYEEVALADADTDADTTGHDTTSNDTDDDGGYVGFDDQAASQPTDVTEGDSVYAAAPAVDDHAAAPLYDAGESPYAVSSDDQTAATSSTDDAAATADHQAHADAAHDAQAQADAYVDQGDYAAASHARETAEDEAYAAGDSSMLGSSDSGDLANAAYQQDLAHDYQQQQADHIADGNYAAAQEDAQNAAYATGNADYLAGGSDHTGQSDMDAYNLGNAVYDDKQADYFADNAQWYAAHGDTDAAQSSMGHAIEYNESADTYAAHADPTSTMYEHDPSSAVDAGGSYDHSFDAGHVDTSYDMGHVDTGMDTSVDMSATSYDHGMDDGTV